MNRVYLTGKVVNKEVGIVQQSTGVPVSILLIETVNKFNGIIERNKIRISTTGILATYVEEEIEIGYNVIVTGRIKNKVINSDGRFYQRFEVRATHVARLEQDEYE